ncbi:hypothetical protein [Marinobacterium stanieri]|uniref:Uncharacterized protein n=1 Tax=Marinobacterium stanieri TaxID=49186 RepID=A0A1N6X8W4_9GAMM|nr:hypothetical protein [Marinobacterium stanieri]SIQ98671.1 hypothetical protein SAMN05421647_11318 [Marinobacterium stanieri]
MKARTGILTLAVALFVASFLTLSYADGEYRGWATDDTVNEGHGKILLEHAPYEILGYIILNKEIHPEKYDRLYFLYKASIYLCGISIVMFLYWILSFAGLNIILIAFWMIFSYAVCGVFLKMSYTGAFRVSADSELFKGFIDYPLFELSGIKYHLKSESVNTAVKNIDDEINDANNRIKLLHECFPDLNESEFLDVYKEVFLDKRNSALTQEYMSCLAAGIKPKWTPEN